MEAGNGPGRLGGLLDAEGIDVPPGFVTVLVAPNGMTGEEFADRLAGQGGVRVLALDDEGNGTCGDVRLPRGDEDAWDAFASSSAREVVVVDGPLADAAAASIRFEPAMSLAVGGSIHVARVLLSASATKARLAAVSNSGDLGAVMGRRDVPDHAALSDMVGRIVGYAWRLDGHLVANEAVTYPDGLDSLGEAFTLVDPDQLEPVPDTPSDADAAEGEEPRVHQD